MFSWHAIPFARLLAPLIIGIFIAVYAPSGLIFPLICLSALLAILIFLHSIKSMDLQFRFRLLSGIVLSSVLILLGYARTFIYNEEKQPHYFTEIPSPKYYKLTVDDAVVEKTKYYRCYAKVDAITDSLGGQHEVNGTVLLYIRKSGLTPIPMIGDGYLISAKLMPVNAPQNPGEFNYKRYLSYHNIRHQLFCDSSNAISQGVSKNSIYRKAVGLRDHSLTILRQYIVSEKELGVAEALLLGYKDDLDPDIVGAFSRTGTLHVLAVSGLHAGIIYLILAFFTAPLTRIKSGKVIQVILILFGIWFYAFVTGLSSSVLRASVMFSFMATGKLLNYNVNIYNNIFSSAFLLLLYNPYFIMDVGFQLSYLAVLGIVFIQPIIAGWYIPRHKIDKYIWGLISVSLAAQFLTFPISIFYFHQFPNYFLLSNLMIIPVTSLVLIGLIALLAFHSIPFIGLILGKCIHYILQFNNFIVQGIDDLPFSYINGLNLNLPQMLMMYVIVLLFLSFVIHRKKYLLFLTMGSIFCFGAYFSLLRYYQLSQKILVVHNIKGHDVITCIDGRDATIISDSVFLKNDRSIQFFIEPYFWSKGVKHIDRCNFQNTFVKTNIKNVKNIGLQFYDIILTIDFATPETVRGNGICLLKAPDFENFTANPNTLKFSANIGFFAKEKAKKRYFNRFKNNLNEVKSFILIEL